MSRARTQPGSLGTAPLPQFERGLLVPGLWPTWLGLGLLALLALLPRGVRNRFAGFVGDRVYRQRGKRCCIAMTNLRLCYPDKSEAEIEALTRSLFRANFQVMLDLPTLWWSSDRKFVEQVKLVGDEHIDVAHASGKSVILLTCHSAALEFGGVRISHDHSLVSVFKPLKNPLVNWLVYRARVRFGARLAVREDGLRPVVKATKQGSVFYYIPDEDLGSERTVFAPFFAAENKATIPMLGRLAQLCDALVIPCYTHYRSDGCYEVRMLPPLQAFPVGEAIEDSRLMNRSLEELISLAPEQYMWTLSLFRTRPEGEPYPYQECR